MINEKLYGINFFYGMDISKCGDPFFLIHQIKNGKVTDRVIPHDFGQLVYWVCNQTIFDRLIYGDNYWDYAEELVLNLKHQGYIK